jgi:hypothetical protein
MTTPKDNGEPAFQQSMYDTSIQGMTLRDWFAGMALQGQYASCRPGYDFATQADAAKQAYSIADAMLAARKGDA